MVSQFSEMDKYRKERIYLPPGGYTIEARRGLQRKRENRILEMLSNGKTVKEIGFETGAGMVAVSLVLTRLRKREGFRTNFQALACFCKERFVKEK